MKTYAQIIDGTVHWIFNDAELPEFNPDDIYAVEITNLNPQPQVGWVYDGAEFSAPAALSIATLRASKSDQIRKACEAHILAGFESSALGAAYRYPSNDRDQVNLSGSVSRSILPAAQPGDAYPFLCMDAGGVWDYRLHTAAQIQAVGAAAYDFILAARVKNATLQAQIEVATNQGELDEISW